MMNSIELYYDSGYRTGKAMKQGDAGLVAHEKGWYQRAKALECKEDQVAAGLAFSQGYSDANPARKPEYFL